MLVTSLPIFCRDSPNTPCPANTCVIRKDNGSPSRFVQTSQFRRTDLTIRWLWIWPSLVWPGLSGFRTPLGALRSGAGMVNTPTRKIPFSNSLWSWWRSSYAASSVKADCEDSPSDLLPTPELRTVPGNGQLSHIVGTLQPQPHRYLAASHIRRWLPSSLWGPSAWSAWGEAQVFHLKPYLDVLPVYIQTQVGQRSPPTPPVIKPDNLRLGCGHPQAQPAYGTYRSSDDELVVAQCLVPPTSPGQEQHVVSVSRHACVRSHETAKHRVVADDPQNRSQNKILRNTALDGSPSLFIPAGVLTHLSLRLGRITRIR